MDYRAGYIARAGINSSLSKGKGLSTVQSLEGPTTIDLPLLDDPSCGTEPIRKIMSIELAMKRELAYRRKMEGLSLRTPGNSRQFPLCSQDASKYPSLVGVKRKEPSSNQRCLPPQQPKPSYTPQPLQKKVLSFTCEKCQVPCSSLFNLNQHFKGSKHKAKLKELEGSRKNGEENGKQPLWCELCGVTCTNWDCLQQHLTGKKHLAHLLAIEDARQMREEAEAVKFQLKNVQWEMSA
ncbi:uncharacterized protein LOC122078402 [Macadamia integrifolia]|uniref:uncharacterized protein LOC122078402 n=1 Tax=Macadamia integrifolia TaxID=60698 RepID=UPI001C4F5078|nr:uncharacterized protein LOC122078402 [Macadamia integrifolia]